MSVGNNNKKKTGLASVQALYEQARAQFAPGGAYTKGVEAAVARQGEKAMSSGMQNLVSSGLAGSTMSGSLGNKFAEEVAAPALASAESERATNLANLDMQYANMLNQLEQSKTQTDTARGNYQQQGSITAAMANKPRTSVIDTGYADRMAASKVTTGSGGKKVPQVMAILSGAGTKTSGSTSDYSPLANTMKVNGQTYTYGTDGLLRNAMGQDISKMGAGKKVAYASPWEGPN